MSFLIIIDICLCALFLLCYSYQFLFLFIAYFSKKKKYEAKKISKIAVLISARNESSVIGGLLESLKMQDYPKECLKVFVVADNCTDNTKQIAEENGAVVYEREDKEFVGKGYALDFLISNITRDFGEDAFDGYLVFDADNLIEKDFVSELNKVFTNGYECVVGYRNSKNYGENWISAGQGLCFLRDMVLLNRARMAVGACCFVSGTGFLFSRKLCKSFGGSWPFHMLTEDGEFTVYNTINGNKIGFCDTARLYDEQTAKFSQSWNQRIRWCRGGVQIFAGYFKKLIKGIFSKNHLACFDMTMCMAPAYLISVAAIIVNTVSIVTMLFLKMNITVELCFIGLSVAAVYLALLVFSFSLTVSEWHHLRAKTFKKILYMFTFPLFMFTYIPIAFVALFKKNVKWKPIVHDNSSTIDEITEETENKKDGK